MTDPTPEKRAARWCDNEACGVQPDPECYHCRCLSEEISAAAAEMQERCAVLAEGERHTIPLDGESIDESVAFVQRCIAAAIRALK